MKHFKLLLVLCMGLVCCPIAKTYGANGDSNDVNASQAVQQKKAFR
jgi:hypothetical protein